MNALDEVFDGEVHWFVPGEDFHNEERFLVKSIEEDEDEELMQWEAPTPYVEYGQSPALWGSNGPPSGYPEEACWGGLCVAMASLVAILGGRKKMYQHNRYDDKTKQLVERRYSFQYVPEEGGFEGGRV